jgi:hypothetical protein
MIGGNWLGGIGLVLAGFGGHAVMPSLARDMKHPERFDKVINKAFVRFPLSLFCSSSYERWTEWTGKLMKGRLSQLSSHS